MLKQFGKYSRNYKKAVGPRTVIYKCTSDWSTRAIIQTLTLLVPSLKSYLDLFAIQTLFMI